MTIALSVKWRLCIVVYNGIQCKLTRWRQLAATSYWLSFSYLLAFSSPLVSMLNHTSRDFVTWPAILNRTRRDFVVMTPRKRGKERREENFLTQMACSSASERQRAPSHRTRCCHDLHSWDAEFDRCANAVTCRTHSLLDCSTALWDWYRNISDVALLLVIKNCNENDFVFVS